MAEGKRKWTSVFQTGGNRFIIRNERRADVASIPTKVEGAADYANLIVTAVNTYPAVEGLVKALEETLKFIESQMHYSQPSYDSGLEPSDQFTYDASPVACAAQDALSRFRSLQNGGES